MMAYVIFADGPVKSRDMFGEVAAPAPMESAMLAPGSQLGRVHQVHQNQGGTSGYVGLHPGTSQLILHGKQG